MRSQFAVGVSLLPLLIAAACVAQAPTNSADGFKALIDADWKYWMSQYPEVATSLGIRRAEREMDGLLGRRHLRQERLPPAIDAARHRDRSVNPPGSGAASTTTSTAT